MTTAQLIKEDEKLKSKSKKKGRRSAGKIRVNPNPLEVSLMSYWEKLNGVNSDVENESDHSDVENESDDSNETNESEILNNQNLGKGVPEIAQDGADCSTKQVPAIDPAPKVITPEGNAELEGAEITATASEVWPCVSDKTDLQVDPNVESSEISQTTVFDETIKENVLIPLQTSTPFASKDKENVSCFPILMKIKH